MDDIEEPVNENEKDYTRPTFNRKPGELGIFIDVYDAIPNVKDAFGSRQYFLMTLIEKFYLESCKGEMYKIKGFFHKRNLLNNVTLEYFSPGVLLIVNINDLSGLHNMMTYYESGKLNNAFVECFVNEKLERKLDVTKLKLKIKIFPDEVEMIGSEFGDSLHPKPYKLIDSKKDMEMIHLIKRYQNKSYYKKMTRIKDQEAKFELYCPEFLVYLKQFCSMKGVEINCLQDIQRLYQQYSQIEDAQSQLHLFRTYLETIAELQQLVRDAETHVLFPLTQLKIGFETPDQRRVNLTIQQKISDLKLALREKNPLKLYSGQVDMFIPKTDRKQWGGLLYVIPASVSILSDIDQQIDDYFQLGNLNEVISKWEHKLKNTAPN